MSQDDRARTTAALSFGPFSLFARERRLERDGQPIKVGSRALDALIFLTERAGEILSKEDFLARVWPETAVEESGLRVHIAALRKALRDGVDDARYIRNVPGRGYAFVGAVTRTVFMTALAEGLALCGQFSEALSAIELALSATARNGGASFDLPEMLRIKGHLLSTKPQPDLAGARLSLEDALESAKRQGALGWELRAATTMARFLVEQGREQEGREFLATTYDKFTQGFQTADLRAAKRLLSEV
jgi:DNA-binding winged helix-turn-helix (wHTH) protein